MNMKILAVVTPPSIYYGCSTWKTLWEEKFTGEEKFTLGEFTLVNINNCGRRYVMKHREIKDIDKYIKLDISSKFGSLNKMIIICSEPKNNFCKISKGDDYLSESQDKKNTECQGTPLEMSV